MKNKIFLGLSVFAILLSSCNEDWGEQGTEKGAGYISPLVSLDTQTLKSASVSTRNDDSPISEEDLMLRLSKKDGSASYEFEYKDFPVDKQFSIGEYTLEAYYGNIDNEGFELPHYYGSQSLMVKDGETTPVNLSAKLANCLISIQYSETFMKYMLDWKAKINNVEVTKDEDRPVYVKPGNTIIKISVTKPNGTESEFTLDPLNTEARHLYQVNITVNESAGGIGDATLQVEFDEALDAESVEIDLSDEVLSAPKPVIDVDGFQSGEPIEMVEGLLDVNTLSMSLIAMSGLKEVTMKTTSPSLIEKGWPETIDLMQATATQQSVLTSLGLNVLGLWKTPGEMAYIDFSNVVEHISANPVGDNLNTFSVTVKDKLMRESEHSELIIKVDPITLVLSSIDKTFNPGEDLLLKLEFNGSKKNLEDNLKITFINERGVQEKLSVQKIEETDGYYTVTVTAPDINHDLQMRANCGNVESAQIIVPMAPFEVEVNDLNVFATYALVKVVGTPGNPDPVITNVKFSTKNDDSTFSVLTHESTNGAYFKLTGLKDNKDYNVRVEIDGQKSKTTLFHTETATPLPNGNFEDLKGTVYSGTANQGGRYAVSRVEVWRQNTSTFKITEATGWATSNLKTMNGKTIHENSDNTWFNQPSVFNSTLEYKARTAASSDLVAYNSVPDHYKNFEPKSGDNAMVIRNVGWDPNGTVPGDDKPALTYSTNNYYNHTTPNVSMKSSGRMVLGTTNDGYNFNEGALISSRPSKLTGWYIYKQDSGDSSEYGVINVKVLDENDNIITSGTQKLDPVEQYTQFTLNFKEYALDSNKASRICVMISSSNHENESDIILKEWKSNNESYMLGSTLVVDDFEFVY